MENIQIQLHGALLQHMDTKIQECLYPQSKMKSVGMYEKVMTFLRSIRRTMVFQFWNLGLSVRVRRQILVSKCRMLWRRLKGIKK